MTVEALKCPICAAPVTMGLTKCDYCGTPLSFTGAPAVDVSQRKADLEAAIADQKEAAHLAYVNETIQDQQASIDNALLHPRRLVLLASSLGIAYAWFEPNLVIAVVSILALIWSLLVELLN